MTASFDGALGVYDAAALDAPLLSVAAAHGRREPWDVRVLSSDAGHLRVVSGGKDCFLRVWQLDVAQRTHATLQTVETPSQPVCVSGVADKFVGGCANGSLYFYDVVADQEGVAGPPGLTVNLHRDQVTSVAWRASDRCVTSSLDHTVKLLDIDSGICLKTLSGARAVTASAAMDEHTVVYGLSDGQMALGDWREATAGEVFCAGVVFLFFAASAK